MTNFESRRLFLSQAGIGLTTLFLGACSTPKSAPTPEKAKTTSPAVIAPSVNGTKLDRGSSNISLSRTDGSEILVAVTNNYPRPLGINSQTFEEIIKQSETDQGPQFPKFSLVLENKGIGDNGVNSRKWDIENNRFTNVRTEVMLDLKSFDGILPAALMIIKYQGRAGVKGSGPERILSYISDNDIKTNTIQDLMIANLTGVLAEEMFEANWSARYLEKHTVEEYQRDFPTPQDKDRITDTYSLPHKIRIFKLVLEKKLPSAFTFSQSALVTKETFAAALGTMGFNATRTREVMNEWASRLQAENIR